MPERDSRPRTKAGVHGWRAFLWMFGCGTTAAVLVVVVVIGIARALVDTVADPISSGEQSAFPSRDPRESMSPGLLDLCDVLQQDALPTGLYPRRQDEGGTPPDSATVSPKPDSGFRTVEDECAWLISPDGISDWRLELSYTAYIESSSETSVVTRAKRLMDTTEGEYASDMGEETQYPGKSTWGDAATAFYVPGERSVKPEYAVIMRKKGVVCELTFQPLADDAKVDETSFETEADPALTALSQEIHHLLPD